MNCYGPSLLEDSIPGGLHNMLADYGTTVWWLMKDTSAKEYHGSNWPLNEGAADNGGLVQRTADLLPLTY